jgi:tetratricopeptide (TPR) repeat protein
MDYMSSINNFEKGENFFKIGKYQEASKVFSTLLKKTRKIEDRVPILFYAIDSYRLTGNMNKTNKLLKELEEIVREFKKNSPDFLLQYLFLSSKYLNDLGAYEKALNSIKEAFDLFKDQTNIYTKRDEIEAVNIMGASQTRLGNYVEALDAYKRSKDLAEEVEDQKGIIVSLNNSADILVYLGDRENAVKHYLQALEKTKNQMYFKAAIYSGLAQITYFDREYEEALIFIDQVNNINQEMNLLSCFNTFLETLVLIENKSYTQALNNIEKLKSYKSLNSDRADTWINYTQAYYYFNTGNNDLANKFCLECFNLILKTNDTFYLIKTLILMAEIYLVHFYRTRKEFLLNKIEIIILDAYEQVIQKKFFPLQVELYIMKSKIALASFNMDLAVQFSDDALSLARSLPLKGEEIRALIWFNFLNNNVSKMKRYKKPKEEVEVEQIISYLQKIRDVVTVIGK